MDRLYARAVSFVVLRFPEPIIGQILDISVFGASLLYFQRHTPADETLCLDIFTSDNQFVMKEIHFSIVEDVEVPIPIDLGSISLRKRGVEFPCLNKPQRTKLKHFMRIYGVGGNRA